MTPFVHTEANGAHVPGMKDSQGRITLAPFNTHDEVLARRYAEFAADLNLHDNISDVTWPRRWDLMTVTTSEETMTYEMPDTLRIILTEPTNPRHRLAMKHLLSSCQQRHAYLENLIVAFVEKGEERSGRNCGDFETYEQFAERLMEDGYDEYALPIFGWAARFKQENKDCFALINMLEKHIEAVGEPK